jgi:hypothetical protein
MPWLKETTISMLERHTRSGEHETTSARVKASEPQSVYEEMKYEMKSKP